MQGWSSWSLYVLSCLSFRTTYWGIGLRSLSFRLFRWWIIRIVFLISLEGVSRRISNMMFLKNLVDRTGEVHVVRYDNVGCPYSLEGERSTQEVYTPSAIDLLRCLFSHRCEQKKCQNWDYLLFYYFR